MLCGDQRMQEASLRTDGSYLPSPSCCHARMRGNRRDVLKLLTSAGTRQTDRAITKNFVHFNFLMLFHESDSYQQLLDWSIMHLVR